MKNSLKIKSNDKTPMSKDEEKKLLEELAYYYYWIDKDPRNITRDFKTRLFNKLENIESLDKKYRIERAARKITSEIYRRERKNKS